MFDRLWRLFGCPSSRTSLTRFYWFPRQLTYRGCPEKIYRWMWWNYSWTNQPPKA